MTPAAILFDLDDTILGYEGGDYHTLWLDSVNKFDHVFPDLAPETLADEIRLVSNEFWSDPDRHRIGRLAIRNARREIVRQAASNLQQKNEAGVIAIADDFHEVRENTVTPFVGAIDALRYFRDSPIKTALITNGHGDVQRPKIDKFQLDQYFDLIQIEGEFGIGKPEPEAYMNILSELGVGVDETWIVGDNLEWEVLAPQELGFFTIWNDHCSTGLPEGCDIVPDKIVTHIHELIAFSGGTEAGLQ